MRSYDIQCTTGFEPFYLLFIISMIDRDRIYRSIFMIQIECQRHARCKTGQAIDIDIIIFLHLIIVFAIGKSERKHTLLFQIRFVNAGKASDQYRPYTKMARLHRRMFSR